MCYKDENVYFDRLISQQYKDFL